MAHEFVNPNWHIVLIHYPLALLTLGVVIEVVTLFWRRNAARTLGRWMILLGTLLGVPTLTSGIYAFREVVTSQSDPVESPWYEAVESSSWSSAQWEMMRDHIWLASVAMALFLLVVVLYLATSESLRRKLYWPMLLVVVVGLGLLSAAAWHAGEAVYRHGTAVAHVDPARPDAHDESAEHDDSALPTTGIAAVERRVAGFLPPLQWHLIFAGLATAIALVALALSIKRWEVVAEPSVTPPVSDVPLAFDDPIVSDSPNGSVPAAYAARFWLLASLLVILTAAAGVWAVGGWTWHEIEEAFEEVTEHGHSRLLIHTIAGSTLLVLGLILAAVVRFAHRAKVLVTILMALALVAVVVQFWSGIFMIYDSHQGSLLGFQRSPAAPIVAPTQPSTRP